MITAFLFLAFSKLNISKRKEVNFFGFLRLKDLIFDKLSNTYFNSR